MRDQRQRMGDRAAVESSSSAQPAPGKQTLVQLAAAHAGPAGSAPAPAPVPGDGAAMPSALRHKMEGSFGADFSSVRVHEGEQASQLGAVAYAQGTDLHFAPGQYQPDTQSGQALIGHELAHVVQQRDGRVAAPAQAKGAPVVADPGLEHEADRAGQAASRGEPAGCRAGVRRPRRARRPRSRCPSSPACRSSASARRSTSRWATRPPAARATTSAAAPPTSSSSPTATSWRSAATTSSPGRAPARPAAAASRTTCSTSPGAPATAARRPAPATR